MRLISREDALRICEYQPVLVEFNNQGLRSSQPFNPGCQFYRSNGPYDFQSARYFLVNGQSGNGSGTVPVPKVKKPPAAGEEGSGEEWAEAEPSAAEVESKPPPVTVTIMSEDGKKPAPKGILPGTVLQLKAVPSRGTGTFAWKSRSKALKVENAGNQIVSISIVANQREAPTGEVLELVFTPSNGQALSPLSHTISVIKVMFMKNDGHAFGYDEYSEIPSKDQNWNRFQFKPDSKLDILSVQTGKTGLVDVHFAGTEGKTLYFKAVDPGACECKPKDATKNPIVLEVRTKGAAKYKETKIEARYGDANGPVAAEISVTILKALEYKAKYFRVEDPGSPGTKLTVAATPSAFEKALSRIYKSGIAKWKIEGSSKTISSKYDVIKNGALDLEPGMESEELKHIIADCKYKGTRVVHVHSLRWSYFLASDAGPLDTKIKLKSYGGYLDFVGTNNYVLEDTAGKSLTVKIKSVDRANAEFELSAPLGVELKVANKAALLWPLGGLSGDPTLVSDFGGLSTLIGIVAHELGHSNAGLKDIAEISNIMHGVAEGNEGVRGRDLPLFYHPDKKEKQWSKMPGRS